MRPPKRGSSDNDRTEFHAYMLLPGLSVGFHAATLRRCRTSVESYRRQAREAASQDALINELMITQLCELRVEDGLEMARLRGTARLPHYSLLAMIEFRARGMSRAQLAVAFCCSLGTVARTLKFQNYAYDPLSGMRRLSRSQEQPPGKFRKS